MEAADMIALVSALAAVASAVATVFATRAASASARSANSIIDLTKSIASTQNLLTQRQLILPLWDHITSIHEIIPSNPNTEHTQQAAHVLEIVALCCEGGMIDEKVIKRTFRKTFIDTYNQIMECKMIPRLNKSGKTLLMESPAAMKFYDKLVKEHAERDALEQVGS